MSRIKLRIPAALLATLAAMTLAACGGGSDEEADITASAATPVAAVAPLRATATSTVAMTKVAFTNTDGQALDGFFFHDNAATPRNAAVVLMHGCSGVWSNGVIDTSAQPAIKSLSYIHRRWGEALAKAGYEVLLVDSFTPRGLTNECGNGTAGLNEAVVRPRDALAGRAWLVSQGFAPAARVALLGWSNGGSATLATMDATNEGVAGSRPFAEAFSFYPGCGLLNNFGGDASTLAKTTWKPYAPVTIFHGGADPLGTDNRCANRISGAVALGASTATGNAVAMVTYAGAHHSFDQIDLSKALVSPFTADDQAAQTAADASVMARLATIFP